MRTALTTAMLILAAGCGGGGGGSGGAVAQPAPAAPAAPAAANGSAGGIWFVPGTPETAVTMFIAESGLLWLFDQGWIGTGAVIVVNGAEVAGSFERIELNFVTANPRETRQSCEITGTVQTRTSLSLTILCEDWQSATVAREFDFLYDARYGRDSSLDAIAGNYTVPIAALTNTLSINNDGAVFGMFQNGGADCTVNGRVELIDPDFTIYGVELTLSLCAGSAGAFYDGETLSGLIIAEVGGQVPGAFLLLASFTVDGGLAVYSLLYEPA